MVATFNRFAALLFVLLLVACQYSFGVSIAKWESGIPTFDIDKRRMSIRRQEITSVIVYEETTIVDGNASSVVWAVHSSGERLRTLKYGVVPEEFREVTRARILQPGEEYTVVFGASGGGRSGLQFSVPITSVGLR